MSEIGQGKFRVFTTKEDAIRKFRQMQGLCRERMSDEESIEFLCSKRGRITLGQPNSRRAPQNLTELVAKVTEEKGETYVVYRTTFSQTGHISNLVSLGFSVAVSVLGIVFAIVAKDLSVTPVLLVFGLGLFLYELLVNLQKWKRAPEIPTS